MTNGTNRPQQYWQPQQYQQPSISQQAPTPHVKVKQRKRISLSVPVFVIMIVAIVVAFILGFIVSRAILSSEIHTAESEISSLKSNFDKKSKSQQNEKQQAGTEPLHSQKTEVVFTGGAFEGKWQYDNAKGVGYFTVKNNSAKTIDQVDICYSYVDGSGNMLGEQHENLSSAIQPGQSANVEFNDIDLGKTNAKYLQATQIIYSYSSDSNDSQTIDFSHGPRFAIH